MGSWLLALLGIAILQLLGREEGVPHPWKKPSWDVRPVARGPEVACLGGRVNRTVP